MEYLVWIGAVVSLIGLVGLIASIRKVARAKKTATSDEELRAMVQKAIPLNMGSLGLSVIGLMIVIVAISLG